MNDNIFAPPGSNQGGPTPDEQRRVGDEGSVATDSSPSEAPVHAHPTAATPVQPATAATPAQAPRDPLAPDAQGVISTAEPSHDGAGYEPPEPPQAPPSERPVGRVRKRAVAGIAATALLLGVGGGFGGAWAYDEFFSSTPTVQVATSDPVERAEDSVAAVAASVMPSVVSLEASVGGIGTSTGSGFVIREDGYILTNNHVVEGAQEITVVMSDGTEFEAEVVGATADYDLAVVSIDAQGLAPLTFADSDEVVVGDDTIAVGSPLGLQSTVTTGIVSAVHRPVTAGDSSSTAFIDAIQTDAAINPGNSGGPLLNASGEVIGVNSAIAALPGVSSSSTGSVGLGFAIPSNQAMRTAEQLIETGTATYPVIGVQLDERYTGEGVLVIDDELGVVAGGPADNAGVEPGDVITGIDGRPITHLDKLVVAIRAKAVGDDVVLTIQRDGEELEIRVTLDSSAQVDFQLEDETTEPQE
ncbi:S1C family serine protease [uncultured Demequina sp.]|mgnify:CR=1 FL=1|uniref:S1C family serine protease n=1 Tax=uncultured Demequina sp. TaxID=693499 RepID=UPI0025CD4D32|nr:trypsin-like peptidase domain-containing protein [uncultured Demequina sp.]